MGVSKVDCADVDSNPSWSFSYDATESEIILWQSSLSLKFNDCEGMDLAEKYKDKHSSQSATMSHRITGECEAAEDSFLVTNGYRKQEHKVTWVKVAGKGAYAEPDNPKHTEQFLDGTHTSMSREEFEAVWAQSNQILMRQCKFCTGTHRYVYLKRYDDNNLLPPNVDLINMVKDNWKQYASNTVHEDFDLYSSYDDALQEKNPWHFVNSNYYNIGFARDSCPEGYVYNQWNVWETPLHNKHYGQRIIAFYVALPCDDNDSVLKKR